MALLKKDDFELDKISWPEKQEVPISAAGTKKVDPVGQKNRSGAGHLEKYWNTYGVDP
jgi:hypothetical protein